jgi:hypothetical protein
MRWAFGVTKVKPVEHGGLEKAKQSVRWALGVGKERKGKSAIDKEVLEIQERKPRTYP